jgi:hypothetical protein
MAIPADPVAHFILIQADFSFAQGKTVLHRPTLPGDVDELLEGCGGGCVHDLGG